MVSTWGPDGDRTTQVTRGAIGWGIVALESAMAHSRSLAAIYLGGNRDAQQQGLDQMQLAHDQLRAAFDESAH